MARRSPLSALFALALVGGAAWAYSGPYRAFADLKTAAAEGDRQAMEELVDFPAFRESVKDAIGTSVQRGLDGGERPGLLGTLGGMLAGAVAAPLVDQVVTPRGIAALTEGVRPGDREEGASAAADGERQRPGVRVRRGYEDLSTFVVRLHHAETDDELLSLVMRREGLDWRLSEVRLPDRSTEPRQGEDEQ